MGLDPYIEFIMLILKQFPLLNGKEINNVYFLKWLPEKEIILIKKSFMI